MESQILIAKVLLQLKKHDGFEKVATKDVDDVEMLTIWKLLAGSFWNYDDYAIVLKPLQQQLDELGL